GEHNETECSEHVVVYTDEQQRAWYGEHDPVLIPMRATWNATDEHWRTMNDNVIEEIAKRVQPRDLILILAGWAQKPIADAFPNNISCEWAAGYEGICTPYVCFESNAWMHYLYGKNSIGQGRFYDTIIPNYFRPEDFSYGDDREDYLLFVGRVTG